MAPDRLSPCISLESSKQFPGRTQKVAEDSDHSSGSGSSTNQRMRVQFLGGAQETVLRIHPSESQAILTEIRERQAAAFLSAFPAKQMHHSLQMHMVGTFLALLPALSN